MNVVMTGAGKFIEVQGTAEGAAFSRGELDVDARPRGARASARSSTCSASCSRCPRAAHAVTLRLVVATANPDKAREIADVLDRGLDVELIPRPASVPEVEETGTTLLENARLKAEALRDATGRATRWPTTPASRSTRSAARPASGAPATRARTPTYADNVEKLVARDGRGPSERRGRPGSGPWSSWPAPTARSSSAEGVVGRGDRRRAARHRAASATTRCSRPPAAGGRTFAELTLAEKHAISHRGRALRALAARLREAEPPTDGVTGSGVTGCRSTRRPRSLIDLIEAIGGRSTLTPDTDPDELRALMTPRSLPCGSRSHRSRTGRSPARAVAIPVRIYRPEGDAPKPVDRLLPRRWLGDRRARHPRRQVPASRRRGRRGRGLGRLPAGARSTASRLPVEDCVAALRWVREHAAELGGDPTGSSVAGDSAGGNLAAVVAQLARDAAVRRSVLPAARSTR